MSPFAESVLDFEVALQPKQDDLLKLVEDSDYTDIGYGGRRGGGKSAGWRRVMILRRLKYCGTPGLMLRRTYDELYKNHIVPLFHDFPFMQEWWSEKHKAVNFPNGSVLYFGYAQHERDVFNFVGSEFGDICPEESGLFTERELQILKGSCRFTGYIPTAEAPVFIPKMFYSFMPGGVSHFYLKRVFKDMEYTPKEIADGQRFVFLEAYGWDNVEWCRNLLAEDGKTEADFYRWPEAKRKEYFLRSEYGKTLSSITDDSLRQAWLEGSWEKFEGLVFPELCDELHNLDRFLPHFIPGNHKLVSAIDWADSGTVASLESAIDELENILALQEYSESGRLISEHCSDILGMLNGYGKQQYTLMDLPTTNINQKELLSIQDEFNRAGVRTSAAFRSNIEIGINSIKELLKVDPAHPHPFLKGADGKPALGSPRLFISHSRCPMLWKHLKELQRVIDPVSGKIKYVGTDHEPDCLRYIVMSRPRAPKVSLEKRVLAKLDAAKVTDVQSRIMLYSKIASEEKKKGKPVKFFRKPKGGLWRN